ncbi:MAG: extracellular solute-binding protein, partial [Patescibacteria group bacterium]
MDLKKSDPKPADDDLKLDQPVTDDQNKPDDNQGDFDIPFASPVASPDPIDKTEPKQTDTQPVTPPQPEPADDTGPSLPDESLPRENSLPVADDNVPPLTDNDLPPEPETPPLPEPEEKTTGEADEDQTEDEFNFNPVPEKPVDKSDDFWSSQPSQPVVDKPDQTVASEPTQALTVEPNITTEEKPIGTPEIKTGPIWSSSETKTDSFPLAKTEISIGSVDKPQETDKEELEKLEADLRSTPETENEIPSGETEIFPKPKPDLSPTVEADPVLPTDVPEIPTTEVPVKPKNSKKLIVIFAVVIGLFLIFSFLILSALLKSRKSSGSQTDSLTYWGLWEEENVMQGIISDWESQNPDVKINYVKQDKQDYRARLQSAFARGDGPDIFRFHQSWLPMLTNELASVPNSVVTSLELDKSYFPVVSQKLKVGDQFYGVPMMMDTLAMFYNKDILSAANKTTPKTWWGLRQTAKEITVKDESGKIGTAGVALGTTNNVDHWSDILGLMILQNGGNPATPNNQLMEDTLTFYTIFSLNDQVWDETLPSSTLAFATNKLAFYFAPSWRIFNLMEANPNLNFGVSSVPQLPKLQETDWESAESGQAELTNINWSTFWVEGVSLKSKKQKQAWEFLNFLASAENLQKLYTAQSQIRAFGELYPRMDLAQSLESDSLLKPFV